MMMQAAEPSGRGETIKRWIRNEVNIASRKNNTNGTGGETCVVMGLGFALWLVLCVYSFVPLNTVYTNEHLHVNDVPYYAASLSSSNRQAERWAHIDYYMMLLSLPMAWSILPMSVFVLYEIMVNRRRVMWIYTMSVIGVLVVWIAKFAYEMVLLWGCKHSAFCTNENPDEPRGQVNYTFTARLIGSIAVTVLLIGHAILIGPLNDLQNEQKYFTKED